MEERGRNQTNMWAVTTSARRFSLKVKLVPTANLEATLLSDLELYVDQKLTSFLGQQGESDQREGRLKFRAEDPVSADVTFGVGGIASGNWSKHGSRGVCENQTCCALQSSLAEAPPNFFQELPILASGLCSFWLLSYAHFPRICLLSTVKLPSRQELCWGVCH